MRLMLVDDHAPSRKVLTAAFRLRGYECLGVSAADAALAALPSFRPAVVIFEWRLPDGCALAHRLRSRADELGLDARLVVVSTENEPDDFRERYRVDAYLTKPVSARAIEAAFLSA